MHYRLIQNFFNKACTAEEAEQVVAYLKQHPDVLEQYLGKEEWNNLNTVTGISEEVWDFLWLEIRKKNRAKSRIIHLKRIAIAACIAGLIGAAFYLVTPKQEAPVTAKARPLQAQYKTVKNTTNNKLHFTLQDGSVITLSPASSISFNVPFRPDQRDVQLYGEARFKVAKDPSKPFTVYAGSLATTAVGTEFIVSDKNGNTTVKLFEGKVKINTTETNGKPQKEAMLLPGQQLNYSVYNNLLAVNDIASPLVKHTIAKPAKVNKSFTINGNTIQFVSQPLPLVLDKLNDYYSTQIMYTQSEVDTINFTGTIIKTDSLNIILKVIAQMNGLTIHQQNDTLFIQKP